MNYALLLARQRSGTGALGSVLDKHPQLKYLGEVFHPDNCGDNQNYFTFLRDQVAGNPDSSLPDAQYDLFLDFLRDQSAQHPGKTLVVDVKYRSLHHLDAGWRGLVERPTLLQRALGDGAPILHLTRRNSVGSFVSGRLAEANKVWHAHEDKQIKVQSTVLNVRHLSNYIINADREVSLLKEWLAKYSYLETFDYDEMFDSDGLIAEDIASRVAAVLGIAPFGDRAPSFIKQAPARVEDSIENFSLVKRALIGTEFGWMLGKK